MRQINWLLRGMAAGLIFSCAILVGLVTADPKMSPGLASGLWLLWTIGSIVAWTIVLGGRNEI